MSKKRSYTGLGLILGTAVGFSLGQILVASAGSMAILNFGLVGTALGLILGAMADRVNDTRGS